MGRLTAIIVTLTAALWINTASAESHVNISEADCQAIKDGSVALKAVPADVRDACNQIAAVAPAAGDAADAGADAPIDPCTGAGAGNSVYCWGPWAALAPAAGGNPDAGPAVDPIPTDPRPDTLAINNVEPQPDPPIPDPPLGGCAPGASCGFATVIAGTGAVGPADETTVERFDLTADGTEFAVAPGEANEIQSFTMTTQYVDRADGLENLAAVYVDDENNPTEGSALVARVLRNQDGDIVAAADVWVNSSGGTANSGFFVWSRAVSQGELDALNAGAGATLNFSGVMSVDNATVANITLNFGPTSNWTGSWTNPNYNFSAGGVIQGPNFGSDPSQFSANVQDGYVQGALVGALGNRAAAHVIDVTLDTQGAVRDVGLALEQ